MCVVKYSLIPIVYPPNPALGHWIDTQRQQFRKHKRGRPSTLTPKRIQLLEDAEFAWSAHDAAWLQKYNELAQHVNINGVGAAPPKHLATWVWNQRRQYQQRLEGQKVPLTDERLHKLFQLGVLWK